MTLLCGFALAVLVLGEYLDNDRLRFTAKPLASLAFVLVGVFALSHDSSIEEFEIATLVGLVLGALGDVALLSEHGFLAGLGSFLLGHLAYVVAVGTYLPVRAWLAATGPYAAIPAIIGLVALAYLWPKLGKLRVPVIFYVLVIITMVISAIALLRTDVFDMHRNRRELFAVGAVLFFISDLAVARDKFVAKGFANRVWGLPVYYGAQLLIAWSLLR
ncbi:MAG: lysoplasmalogenase [Kofleriaceae bacterium]